MTTNVAWASAWSFPLSYEPNRGKGWRGPCLQPEGNRTIYWNAAGQPTTGTCPTAVIPVIHDPRHDPDAAPPDGRYYRVLLRANQLHLVHVGEDGTLGTGDDVEQPLETP